MHTIYVIKVDNKTYIIALVLYSIKELGKITSTRSALESVCNAELAASWNQNKI